MRLTKMSLCLAFLAVLAVSPRVLKAQGEDCKEACYTIVNTEGHVIGHACVLGEDGWDCNAGTYLAFQRVL